MANALLVDKNYQFKDLSNNPLIGGTLSFFAGGTSTPITVYGDYAGTIVLGPVVTLKDDARINVFVPVQTLVKMVVATASGTVLASPDNMYGRHPANSILAQNSVAYNSFAAQSANTIAGYDGSGNPTTISPAGNFTLSGGVLACSAANTGSKVLVSKKSFNGTTNVTFGLTDGFNTALYTNYEIFIKNYIPSTASANLLVLNLSINGGTSYISSCTMAYTVGPNSTSSAETGYTGYTAQYTSVSARSGFYMTIGTTAATAGPYPNWAKANLYVPASSNYPYFHSSAFYYSGATTTMGQTDRVLNGTAAVGVFNAMQVLGAQTMTGDVYLYGYAL